jgi:hypothetical protein
MDWHFPISQPVIMAPPTIHFGVEINPIALVPPAVVDSDGVYILIDLVNEDLR